MTQPIIVDGGLLALTQQLGAVSPALPHALTGSHARDAVLRGFDMLVAIAALVFVLPLMLLVAAMIALTDSGPVVFGHQRVGKSGRVFRCLKFRTMVPDAEERLHALLGQCAASRLEWERDHKLQNDPRVTWYGNFLRKSSLDELPQLFNVLMGDMSIVGPRPIVQAETARYGRFIANYLSVRPGITGLWQVSGRNDTTYRRRVALDVAYARSKSLSLDIAILARTVPAVFMARGSR